MYKIRVAKILWQWHARTADLNFQNATTGCGLQLINWVLFCYVSATISDSVPM